MSALRLRALRHTSRKWPRPVHNPRSTMAMSAAAALISQKRLMRDPIDEFAGGFEAGYDE